MPFTLPVDASRNMAGLPAAVCRPSGATVPNGIVVPSRFIDSTADGSSAAKRVLVAPMIPDGVSDVPVGAGRAAANGPTSSPPWAVPSISAAATSFVSDGRTNTSRPVWAIWNHFGASAPPNAAGGAATVFTEMFVPRLPGSGLSAASTAALSCVLSVASLVIVPAPDSMTVMYVLPPTLIWNMFDVGVTIESQAAPKPAAAMSNGRPACEMASAAAGAGATSAVTSFEFSVMTAGASNWPTAGSSSGCARVHSPP